MRDTVYALGLYYIFIKKTTVAMESERLRMAEAVVLIKTSCVYAHSCPWVIYLYKI